MDFSKKKKKKKEKEKSYFALPDKCYLIRSCHSLGSRAKKHFTFDSLEYTIMQNVTFIFDQLLVKG